MRAPHLTPMANPMAGWDIGLTAFALACMTTGFWRLWPGGVSQIDAPLGAMILKAGIAALGFVGVATRWESALQAWARNPLMLVLMALACGSAIWAISPAEALRNAIMLIVICVFGVALTLRFKPRELAEICAFAGLFGLMAQFGAHQGMPPVGAFDGDVAFAIVSCAWAAWCIPARRSLWLLALGGSCMLALAARDFASLGAGIGLVVGCGVAQLSALRGRQKAVSVIVSAWVIVALIVGVTLFALFGADPVTTKITLFFDGLGHHAVLGQGFGLAGTSLASSLGAGLGVLGTALAGLIVFATLFQVLLGDRQGDTRSGTGTGSDTRSGPGTRSGAGPRLDTHVAIWFACLGAMLASPADIAMFGPVCILFAATSFSISLSCVSAPRRHESLASSVANQRLPRIQASNPDPISPKARPAARLNSLGLRPRR